MRRWVEYKDGRVTNVDQKRLIRRAKIFQEACLSDPKGYGVEEIKNLYASYVEAALNGKITQPLHDLPYTNTMKEMLLPEKVEDALTYFIIALKSRPAVYGILDTEIIFHHRDQFIKEENGKTYILEYFEDE